MKRQRVIVAVWKEKLTFTQSIEASKAIVKMNEGQEWPFEVAIAPNPFSYAGVADVVRGTPIRMCSQNVLWKAESGSYIGETTIEMLLEFGCNYVIVGHSERRLCFKETNDMIVNRALAAITAGIRPILCIGDTAEEKESNRSKEAITIQLRSFFEKIPSSVGDQDFLIAYEPVWAISTWRKGELPSGKEVQELHAHLRELIGEIKNPDFAKRVSLLYGGSVDSENAEKYMAQKDVDGALVGGASKTPESFVGTLQAGRLGFQNKDRAV